MHSLWSSFSLEFQSLALSPFYFQVNLLATQDQYKVANAENSFNCNIVKKSWQIPDIPDIYSFFQCRQHALTLRSLSMVNTSTFYAFCICLLTYIKINTRNTNLLSWVINQVNTSLGCPAPSTPMGSTTIQLES